MASTCAVGFIRQTKTMQTNLEHFLSPKYRLWSHVLFWVGYLLFFTILDASFYDDYWKAFLKVVTTMPIKMAATYLTLYVFIPNLLDRKKYASFAGLFLLMGVIFGYIARSLLHIYWVPTYVPDYDYAEYPLTHLGKAAGNMISVYTVVFAASAIKLLKRNYQNEKITEQLNKEKLDAELKFLKSQIHPHFLFNTLNNLYALTLQHSPKSSEVVLKLSNLLDYMLYECNVKFIPLRKEISQIKNIIELERLRYGERLMVSFTASGDIKNKQVPPLLMLPFIENAFKHGVSKKMEESFVSIDINVKKDELILRVENSKVDDDPQQDADYTKGIGLRNVRRRLELIYGQSYHLQVFNEEEVFMISLHIPLNPPGVPKETSERQGMATPPALVAERD